VPEIQQQTNQPGSILGFRVQGYYIKGAGHHLTDRVLDCRSDTRLNPVFPQ
jgi:hypothetical protein